MKDVTCSLRSWLGTACLKRFENVLPNGGTISTILEFIPINL
jgi:hypothetical protein